MYAMRSPHTAGQAVLNVGGYVPRQPEMMHSYARLWIAMRLDAAVPSRYCMHDGRGDCAPPLLPTREAADRHVPRQGGSVKRPAQQTTPAYHLDDLPSLCAAARAVAPLCSVAAPACLQASYPCVPYWGACRVSGHRLAPLSWRGCYACVRPSAHAACYATPRCYSTAANSHAVAHAPSDAAEHHRRGRDLLVTWIRT